MFKRPILLLMVFVSLWIGSDVLGGAPRAVLDDNEPGLQFLFSGDPDTTESGCEQSGDRAPQGTPGKVHNELLDCDNWDFKPTNWGQASFLQGAFVLVDSPFSDDGAWGCPGNAYNLAVGNISGPCNNPSVRAVTTHKNQPAGGDGGNFAGTPMDISKDWVFSFDFKVEIVSGDTYGNDKLFDIDAGGRTMISLQGTRRFPGVGASSFRADGTPDRYRLEHGNGAGEGVFTQIDVALDQGRLTVHYKANDQRFDFWFNDDLLLADFDTALTVDGERVYGADFIQLGGGGTSFENVLFDNLLLGVLATDSCDPSGPGTAGVPGDFNCDGVVDVADLGIIGANFNDGGVTYADGDANLDGIVDVSDLGIVGANWSAAQGSALAQALAPGELGSLVPEPTTVALIGAGSLLFARRRRV
tara:strand:+ start:20 stop:1264 length:1245 start_codon:yes stop_codon:yes gene_type:complete